MLKINDYARITAWLPYTGVWNLLMAKLTFGCEDVVLFVLSVKEVGQTAAGSVLNREIL
jgi:hypothetical protein